MVDCGRGPTTRGPCTYVTLLQRKAERPGKRLENNGLDSPFDVENEGVKMIGGVNYEEITEKGCAFPMAKHAKTQVSFPQIRLFSAQVS